MNATRPVGVLILLLWAVQLPAAATPPMDFEGAKWIWYDAGLDTPLGQLPAGSIYLRATFTVPADARLQSAVLAMTADNLYTFHLNGKSAGESLADPNAWAAAKRFDVTRLLVPGRNVLAVEAINTAPGPAGLLARLVIRTAAGKTIEVVSDSSWMGTDREETNWQQPQFSDKAWRAAQVVADYGLRPWDA